MSNLPRGKEMNPTKLKILKTATTLFFKEGYTSTTARRIADAVGISTGNLTFHFPTKEHLLLEMTRAFCEYQWEMIQRYTKYKYSPLLAYALEIAVQTAVCEQSEIARDFYVSVYTQPLTLGEIRKCNSQKAHLLFADYNPDWTELDFKETSNIASGIELSAIMTECDLQLSLENKVSSTLDALLKLYNVPEKEREDAISKIKQMDYVKIAEGVLPEFSMHIEQNIE